MRKSKKIKIELAIGDIPPEWYTVLLREKNLGIDIETSGLNKQSDGLASIQIYAPIYNRVLIIRDFTLNPFLLVQIIELPEIRKIFHNAAFDLAFLMRDYKLFPKNIADTMIAAKFLDPKKQLFFDPIKERPAYTLAALVWHYYEIVLNKELTRSNWFAKKLTKSQLDYMAHDVIYLPHMLDSMESALSEDTQLLLRQAYQCIPVNIALKLRGYDYVGS